MLFIPTHRIIAHRVHENILQETGINLSKSFLAYGSMKPDIAPRLAIKKHYKEHSFDFVLDEIVDLVENGLRDDKLSINNFSTKFGVVSHFLCDFFCLPHHDRDYFHDKLKDHLEYEKLLHEKFKSFSNTRNLKLPTLDSVDKDGFRNLIDSLHSDYASSSKSFETDMEYSVRVSSAVGIIILENAIIPSLNEATANI